MYGGEDTYEWKQKVDARSAYVKELDEQVRLKQEAKEAEKRAAEEYEAKKDAEIEKLAREERVQMQHEQDQHGIPRRRHQQGHPSDSVLGGGGGQFSPPPRPPPNAAPAVAPRKRVGAISPAGRPKPTQAILANSLATKMVISMYRPKWSTRVASTVS